MRQLFARKQGLDGARQAPHVAGIHGHQHQVRRLYGLLEFGKDLYAGRQLEAGQGGMRPVLGEVGGDGMVIFPGAHAVALVGQQAGQGAAPHAGAYYGDFGSFFHCVSKI